MPEVTLRPATTDDLPGIVAVFLDCWRISYAQVLPAATIDAMTDDRAAALWHDALAAAAVPGSGLQVAVADRRVLGVTRHALEPEGGVNRGVVHSLYVSPAAQGLGLGARLLDASRAALERAGADEVVLWVFAANEPTRRFYQHQGWVPDGTTRTQPEFGEPELRLRHAGMAARIVGSGVPGCVLGVAVGDRRVVRFAGVSGPDDEAVTRDTVWDLASVTKVVGTTTALHRLAGLGRLSVDDPVTRWVPGFTGHPGTTVADLLQHQTGLAEWQPIYLAPEVRAVPAADVARRAAAAHAVVESLPPVHPLRAGRHYSDLGFMVLGRVVEAVAGCPLDEAVRRLVAEPLGVGLRFGPVAGHVATSALDDRVERGMVATGDPHPVAWPDDGFGWRTEPVRGVVNDGNCFHAFGGVAGHAGLFGTVDDLLDVGLALSRPSGLFDPAVTSRFLAPGRDPEQAMGWRVAVLESSGRPEPLRWHPGFTGTDVGFVPDAGIAVAMATNRLLAEPVPHTADLWRQVLAAAPELIDQLEER